MNSPRISWQILENIINDEYEYIQYKTYTEEGSFIPGDIISKTIQIWNNYQGLEDVQDANNCKLVMAFKAFEDSFLLNLMTVQIDNNDTVELEIDVDRGIIELGTLSGLANNGTASNNTNYRTIHFTIGPLPDNIKSELKGLYFYLEYDSE